MRQVPAEEVRSRDQEHGGGGEAGGEEGEEEGEEEEEEEEGEEEEGEEGRARRAHALFWEGRRRLLLSEAELHETLWASLSEHVSPPWEPPPQGSEVPPPPKRLPAALGGPADEPEAESEEEHEALGLVGHAAPRWYCRLHYEDWLLALEALPAAKTAPLRSARFFLSFGLDAHGRASAHALYAAACGLVQLLSTLCELQVRGAPALGWGTCLARVR